MQAMNVATGGTLHQDVLTDIYGITTYEDAAALDPQQLHRSVEYYLHPAPGLRPGVWHPVRFTLASPWLSAMGMPAKTVISLLSVHHQAVDRLGKDLEVMATSGDGKVVEGVQHRRFPNVLGVQFHPEYPFVEQQGKKPAAAAADPSRDFHLRFWQVLAGRLKPAPGEAGP